MVLQEKGIIRHFLIEQTVKLKSLDKESIDIVFQYNIHSNINIFNYILLTFQTKIYCNY